MTRREHTVTDHPEGDLKMRDMRDYLRRGFEDALEEAGLDPRRDEVRHAVVNAISPIAIEFGLRDKLVRDLLVELDEWRRAYGGPPAGRGQKLEALEARARIVLDEAEADS
jgi:hypothetical protein